MKVFSMISTVKIGLGQVGFFKLIDIFYFFPCERTSSNFFIIHFHLIINNSSIYHCLHHPVHLRDELHVLYLIPSVKHGSEDPLLPALPLLQTEHSLYFL